MADPSDADLMASFQSSQGAGSGAAGQFSPEEMDFLGKLNLPADATLLRDSGTGKLIGATSPTQPMMVFIGSPKPLSNTAGPATAPNPLPALSTGDGAGPSDDDLNKSFQAAEAQAAQPQTAPAPASAQPQPKGIFSSPGAILSGESANLSDLLNSATFGGEYRLNALLSSLPKLADVPTQGFKPMAAEFSRMMDLQKAQEPTGLTHTINSIAGGIAPAVVLPEVEAPSALGRFAVGAGQGALLGGAEGTGQSRGDVRTMLNAGVPGAVQGALVGGPLGAMFGSSGAAHSLPKLASMDDYARAGVDPMLAVNGPGSAQRIGQMVKGLPMVGAPLQNAAARTASQIDSGVQRVAASLGRSTTPFEAGGALQRGADQAVQSMKDRVNQLYEPINALEANSKPVPVTNAQAAVKDIFANYSTPAVRDWFSRSAPELVRIRDTLENAGVLSRWGVGRLKFRELRAMRRSVGQMLDDKVILGNIDQANLKRLYGAMSDDMTAGARELGGEPAYHALRLADAYNAAMHARVDDTLSTVIKANSREQAYDRVLAMAGSNSRADLAKLQRLARSLPQDSRQEFAAGAIQNLGRDAEGNFSSAKFATAWSKLTPAGKRAIVGNTRTVEDLDALYRVSQQQKAADKFYNHSNSGHVAAGAIAVDRIGEYVMEGHLQNLPHVLLHDLPAFGALYGAAYGAAHLLASPGFARLVLRASKAETIASQKQAALALRNYAKANPSIRGEVMAYQDELVRRFKANAAVTAGVHTEAEMRRRATAH